MKILAIGDFHGKFPMKLKKFAKDVDFVIALGDYAGIEGWRPWLKYVFKLRARGEPVNITIKDFLGKKRFSKLMKDDDLAGREVLRQLNHLNKKVIFVFGNGDDRFYTYPFGKFFQGTKTNSNFVKELRNLTNITYGKKRVFGIDFAGFGGFMDASANYDAKSKEPDEIARVKRVHKRNSIAARKFKSILKGTLKDKIFVFHYPPKGAFDLIHEKGNPYNGESAGVEFFAHEIKKHKPILALCGHMHEYQGVKKIGKTLVVNPGAASHGKAAIIEIDDCSKKIEKIRFVK